MITYNAMMLLCVGHIGWHSENYSEPLVYDDHRNLFKKTWTNGRLKTRSRGLQRISYIIHKVKSAKQTIHDIIIKMIWLIKNIHTPDGTIQRIHVSYHLKLTNQIWLLYIFKNIAANPHCQLFPTTNYSLILSHISVLKPIYKLKNHYLWQLFKT